MLEQTEDDVGASDASRMIQSGWIVGKLRQREEETCHLLDHFGEEIEGRSRLAM